MVKKTKRQRIPSNRDEVSESATNNERTSEHKNNSVLKGLLPDILATVFFVILVGLYFAPSVFDSKVIQQPDIQQSKGMMQDMVVASQAATKDEVIAWTGALYGGMPNYLIYTYGLPSNYITYLDSWIKALDPYGAGIILIALLSFYFLLRVYGMSVFVSIIGSVGFAFASYNVIILEAGHVNKGYVIAYMPLTVAGILALYKEKWILGFLLFVIGVNFSLSYSHPQITYYLALFCAFLFIGICIDLINSRALNKLVRVTALLTLGTILAIGPNLGNLYASWELSKSTLRGPSELTITPDGIQKEEPEAGLDKDYAFMWSYGKSEILTFLIPNAYGGRSGGYVGNDSNLYQELRRRGVNVGQQVQTYTYWGDKPFTSGPVYFGAVLCFLFVFGMVFSQHPLKWWMFSGAVFLTLMSFGKNLDGFNSFLFEYLPLYNKFRTVEMSLVIPGLFIPWMACFGLYEYSNALTLNTKNTFSDINRAIYVAFGVTGGLTFLVFVFPELLLSFRSPNDAQLDLPDWYISALFQDRKMLAQQDSLRSFTLILITAVILYGVPQYQKFQTGRAPNRKSKSSGTTSRLHPLSEKSSQVVSIAMVLLIAVTLFDLWSVDRRYLNESNFSAQKPQDIFQPSIADEIILRDQDPGYRVLNLNGTFSDNQTPFFHRSVGGYHPAKLRRTQELIDFYMQSEMNRIIVTLQNSQTLEQAESILKELPILNLLNTRYIIYNPEQPPLVNNHTYGAAWFIDDIVMASNPNDEISMLQQYNLQKTAIVADDIEELKSIQLEYDPEATIELTQYKPHDLTYQVNANSNQVIIFSEIYYEPGWKVYLNGVESTHFRANWNFRGVYVTPDVKEIRFRFEPDTLVATYTISMYFSILVLLILLLGAGYEIKKRVVL